MGQTRIRIAKIAEWVALWLIPILSALRTSYPSPPTPPLRFLGYIHRFFLDEFVWIVGGVAGIALVAKLVQEKLNPESKIRLKAWLDILLDAYFTGVPEAEKYHNRVTLFKANRKRTALEAHCRSGTQYQRKIQSFVISEDNENANEGIAGQAWFRNATVTASLPDSPPIWRNDDPACQHYATSGYLTVAKAEHLHVRSRSFVATPVRDFAGKKWGVLVLDSRKADGTNPAREELVSAVAAMLGKSL